MALTKVDQGMLTSPLTSGITVATTSGTSIDFTGIPSWVKRITMVLNGVSTNSSSNLLVQVGSGSIATSGYVGGVGQAGPTGATASATTGLLITQSNSGTLSSTGTVVFTAMGSNVWVGVSTTSRSDNYGQLGGTVITLGGALDRIRLTSVGSVDTFDAGSVNILYE
jgi:hypothetical protein